MTASAAASKCVSLADLVMSTGQPDFIPVVIGELDACTSKLLSTDQEVRTRAFTVDLPRVLEFVATDAALKKHVLGDATGAAAAPSSASTSTDEASSVITDDMLATNRKQRQLLVAALTRLQDAANRNAMKAVTGLAESKAAAVVVESPEVKQQQEASAAGIVLCKSSAAADALTTPTAAAAAAAAAASECAPTAAATSECRDCSTTFLTQEAVDAHTTVASNAAGAKAAPAPSPAPVAETKTAAAVCTSMTGGGGARASDGPKTTVSGSAYVELDSLMYHKVDESDERAVSAFVREALGRFPVFDDYACNSTVGGARFATASFPVSQATVRDFALTLKSMVKTKLWSWNPTSIAFAQLESPSPKEHYIVQAALECWDDFVVALRDQRRTTLEDLVGEMLTRHRQYNESRQKHDVPATAAAQADAKVKVAQPAVATKAEDKAVVDGKVQAPVARFDLGGFPLVASQPLELKQQDKKDSKLTLTRLEEEFPVYEISRAQAAGTTSNEVKGRATSLEPIVAVLAHVMTTALQQSLDGESDSQDIDECLTDCWIVRWDPTTKTRTDRCLVEMPQFDGGNVPLRQWDQALQRCLGRWELFFHNATKEQESDLPTRKDKAWRTSVRLVSKGGRVYVLKQVVSTPSAARLQVMSLVPVTMRTERIGVLVKSFLDSARYVASGQRSPDQTMLYHLDALVKETYEIEWPESHPEEMFVAFAQIVAEHRDVIEPLMAAVSGMMTPKWTPHMCIGVPDGYKTNLYMLPRAPLAFEFTM